MACGCRIFPGDDSGGQCLLPLSIFGAARQNLLSPSPPTTAGTCSQWFPSIRWETTTLGRCGAMQPQNQFRISQAHTPRQRPGTACVKRVGLGADFAIGRGLRARTLERSQDRCAVRRVSSAYRSRMPFARRHPESSAPRPRQGESMRKPAKSA